MPINADDIICIEDKTLWSRKSGEQIIDSSSPPPPQTATASAATDNNEEQTECPPSLPEDQDVIKELIRHDKDDDYIPLMSAIALKKEKRMLFLPVEFNTVKIDALVDSAAYNNSISERDAGKIRRNASQCIIKKVPPPVLFKVSLSHTEPTSPHQSQRRSNCRANPHAQIRDHNDTSLLQVCQSYLCTTEPQRQTETISRSA